MIPQVPVHNIYNQSHALNFQQQQQLVGLPTMAGSPTSVETLHSDITSLIETAKKRFAENPFDEDGQKRLKALLDLQSIIQTQQLPPAQLAMVKDQLYKLANPSPPPPPVSIPQPLPVPVTMPLQTPNLAQLLAGTLNQFANTPTPPASVPQLPPQIVHPPLNPPHSQMSPMNDTAALLASLQSAGLLPSLGGLNGLNLTQPPPPPPPVMPQVPFFRSMAPTPQVPTPPPTASKWRSIDVELKTTSLKM